MKEIPPRKGIDFVSLAECCREIADWWDEMLSELWPGTSRWTMQSREDPAEGYKYLLPRPPVHDCGRVWTTTNDGRLYCAYCRTMAAIGASRAPLNVRALDTIVDVSATILRLNKDARQALGDGEAPPPKMRPAGTPDPCVVPSLRYMARQAKRIMESGDGTFGQTTWEGVRRCTLAVRHTVGTAEQTRKLDALCPICGMRSLIAWLERDEIICTYSECRCDSQGCYCDKGKPHTWKADDWPWLAQILAGEESI